MLIFHRQEKVSQKTVEHKTDKSNESLYIKQEKTRREGTQKVVFGSESKFKIIYFKNVFFRVNQNFVNSATIPMKKFFTNRADAC